MKGTRSMRVFFVFFLALLGCRTRAPARDPAVPASSTLAPRPWTLAFLQEAALVADEIRIEGPEDLLTHVAIRQDPEAVTYSTKTTPEGLLQELSVRPDLVGSVEIRTQLDNWALAALQRLIVLQRPGEVPVTLRATGNVVWIPADGSAERRGATLGFQGLRGK